MAGKHAFVLVTLVFFAGDIADCRRSRGSGRQAIGDQAEAFQAEGLQAKDFQQGQTPSLDYWVPLPVVDDPWTVPLEFPGLHSPTSQKIQQLEQSTWMAGEHRPHPGQSQSQWFPLTGQTVESQFTEQRPTATRDCRILYDKVLSRHRHPMLVRPDNEGFLYPDMEGKVRILRINSGKTALASCPGPENHFLLNSRDKIYISCQKGQLYYGKRVVLWSQLGCRRKPRPVLEKSTSTCGSPSSSSSSQGITHTIEWPIRRGIVIPQITFCFDPNRETVLFTHHKVHGRNIDAKIVEPYRPSFKKKDMFTVSANIVYSKREQKALFGLLLQSPDHLTGKKQHYLARGHLAPDSDFILEPEQDATYLYANVVPQWQAINNGNWKSLENSVRDLAKDRQQTLEVWTGVHGILHLPNANNDPVELFLGLSELRRVIPVPALLWKVVHDPITRSALAVVQVNDVRGYGTGPRRSDDLYTSPCHDLCASIPWVDWNVLNIKSGRTFCCSIVDIRRTIPTIPDLGRVSLLSS